MGNFTIFFSLQVIPNGASAVAGGPPAPAPPAAPSIIVQSDQKSSSHAPVNSSVMKAATASTTTSAAISTPTSPFTINLSNGRNLDLSINTVPGWPAADPTLMSQYLQQICVSLRTHGFTDNTVEEIVRSIRCLANHGILTLDTTKSRSPPPPAIWSQDSPAPGNIRPFCECELLGM